MDMPSRTFPGNVPYLRIIESLAAIVRLAVDLIMAECSARLGRLVIAACLSPFPILRGH